MAVPALKIDELLARLEALRTSGARNELELRRLRQDARHLLDLYPSDGDAHMTLGIVACLEGIEEEAVRHHEAALRCGWTPIRAMNYVVTLGNFYRHDEAFHQALDVVGKDRSNLMALRAASRLAYTTGRFRAERNLLTEYAKRVSGELPDDLAEIYVHAKQFASLVEQLDLNDDLLAAFHRPLWELLHTKGFGQDIKIDDQIFSDGGDRFISRTLHLPLSFEDAQTLNWQWVETLSEQDESWPMEKFMITLREAA